MEIVLKHDHETVKIRAANGVLYEVKIDTKGEAYMTRVLEIARREI